MESANLSFRQINLTALSHTPNFKARYEPHYQMRKAIGKKKKKKEWEKNFEAATMALARDYVYKAHLQMEQVGENKKHIFNSTAKCCQVCSDKGDINILYQQLHAALRGRL